MIFAIDEINQNPTLLPNITLGFMIYDSCHIVARALEGSFWMMTGQEEPIPNYRCNKHSQLAAIIGESRSRITIPMARLLGIYGYPQVSYSATVPSLSDKSQFPSFFRTIPSDNFQSYGLVRFLMHFGWTWVGILAEDDEYGIVGSQIVIEEMAKVGVCVAFYETIPLYYSKEKNQHIANVTKKSSANVIVVFSAASKWSPVITEIARQNITEKVWIATEAWSTSLLIFTKENFKTLRGTIGFTVQKGEIPRLKKHLIDINPVKSLNDTFIEEFWEEAFGCKWLSHDSNEMGDITKAGKETALCMGTEKLEDLSFEYSDVSSLRVTYNVYNAVYAIAYALHNLQSCKPGEGPSSGGACAEILNFEPWQLLHYMKNVHFKNSAGDEVYFDASGDPPAVYDIVNWQLSPDGILKYIKVGSTNFSAPKGKDIKIDESAIEWNEEFANALFPFLQTPHSVCSESCPPGYRKAARRGEPVCCFDCIQCSEGKITNQKGEWNC
uniref:G-protein coupled receptors family 3 profile domain-containing protein n=1 Tax=Latimeria chalumnae TaxID=7897 RepID=H3AXA2_LATCH